MRASLPNLRSLSMHATFRKADGFVKRHGHKIETLFVQKGLLQENMDSMPALTSLSLAEVRLVRFMRRSDSWRCCFRRSSRRSWRR